MVPRRPKRYGAVWAVDAALHGGGRLEVFCKEGVRMKDGRTATVKGFIVAKKAGFTAEN